MLLMILRVLLYIRTNTCGIYLKKKIQNYIFNYLLFINYYLLFNYLLFIIYYLILFLLLFIIYYLYYLKYILNSITIYLHNL